MECRNLENRKIQKLQKKKRNRTFLNSTSRAHVHQTDKFAVLFNNALVSFRCYTPGETGMLNTFTCLLLFTGT